jgi:lia operon protein LiaG
VRHPRPFPVPLARLALLAAGALALSPAVPSAQERHVLTGASATIWNLAGEVRLVPGSGNDVVIHLTRGGADGAQLSVAASGGQLSVRYPDSDIVYRGGTRRGNSSTTLRVREDGTFDGSWNGGGRRTRIRTSGSGLEAHADLRVEVPRGRRVEVHLAIGEAFVENVDGELRIDVHAASIRATGTKGRLSLDAGSGSVRVENGEGELDVDTGSGSTTVSGFTGRSINVDAGSGSVDIRQAAVERVSVDVGSGGVDLIDVGADALSVDTGSGSVELSLTKVPRDIEIDTGSGSVRIALPANASLDVDIDTGSGGISSDFAVTMSEVRRRELRGRIGEGGSRLTVSTGSGGVRLLKR